MATHRRPRRLDCGRRARPGGDVRDGAVLQDGPVDGVAGARTTAAVVAFQKVEGLTRDGRPGPEVEAALARASSPRPLVPGGASTRIEVDLARQVLLFWQDGALARILPVSTGSGRYYCNPDGSCEYAVTPTGTYRIGRRYAGAEVAPLGTLYHPMYFQPGHRHPRVGVDASVPGLPRLRPDPHARGRLLLRPGGHRHPRPRGLRRRANCVVCDGRSAAGRRPPCRRAAGGVPRSRPGVIICR